ncbi:MAG: hypothetical protein OIF32_03130 [Campylobacterales bacterium]|nr:hypothetical protein [Campylobacterales bacterium]
MNNILNKINKNELFSYALRGINDKVDLINFNDEYGYEPNTMNFYDYFLLKNQFSESDQKYVGIILDMGYHDLHIYILENYRGKGYLQSTLNQTILPFLSYYKEREIQELTFNSIDVKRYMINEFGFIDTGELSVRKNLMDKDVVEYSEENEKAIDFTFTETEKLRKDLNETIYRLKMINRQLTFKKEDSFEYYDSNIDKVYWELKDLMDGL